MTSRSFGIATTSLLLALALTGCPSRSGTDGGDDFDFDAGNPNPAAACSGGCADNQFCDTVKRVCMPGCPKGCDAGVCLKSGTSFACAPSPVTSCGGTTCAVGQIACLSGTCSCLASALATSDSCTPYGQWCNGGVCQNPRALEQCIAGGPACPSGYTCKDVFGPQRPICTKTCTGSLQCNSGEICFSVGCLPSAFTSGQECSQYSYLADGGLDITDAGIRLRTVPAGNTCLLKDDNGAVLDTGTGAGNCSYAFVKFADDGLYPASVCHPPGMAAEGQACRLDRSRSALATQCSTGLDCIATKGGDEGLCLRMCNANPPKFGITPTPACSTGETCVNQYWLTDPADNSVAGVCMRSCNVFDPAKSICAKVGTTDTSCVPASGNGSFPITQDGSGLCVPRRATVAALGAVCGEVDAFRGAACGTAQVCTSPNLDAAPKCTGVCDLSCNPADGGVVPARCATEPNARCAAGMSCRRITSTTGAVLGFCE